MSLGSTSLEAGLNQWLDHTRKQIEPRFPPELEALYEEETSVAKITALKTATLIGVITGALLTPALWRLMPDARWAVGWLWCGIGLPIGLVSYFVLWTRLPVRWQEVQAVTFGALVALTFSALIASSARDMTSIYLGGMSLLVMLDIIAGGFRFRFASAYSFVLTVIFGIFIQRMPSMRGEYGLVLLVLMTTCSIFAVFGAWRVETEARRSYALMLREHLKQKALTRRNSELDELALRDVLTGLANRRAYERWRMATWSAAAEANAPIGLLVLDIDNFKLYNDAFGHQEGDGCLRDIARCLSVQLRGTTDMVARVGGEEFAVLLPGASLDATCAVAERLRQAVEALGLPHASGSTHRVVTISCGAGSLVACSGRTPEDLFREADRALYTAKKAGRNRVCSIQPGLADNPVTRGASSAASCEVVPVC